jgi:ubiquinone/menaquinone biosynthesis C-methylase UbiE
MREWNQKRGTMHHYDHQNKVYDLQYLEEQDAKIEAALSSMEFGLNEVVLDMGCGTGFLFHHINKTTKLLVGLDVSLKLLQEARKRTKNLSNISLIRADADNTPFQDHIFNKIFATTLLQNMPDPTKTISEMRRIGKPEAIFVVTGLKKKFTPASYSALLKKAQLKVSILQINEHLKDYVAVCTNLLQSV